MPYSSTSSRRSSTFDKLLELYDRFATAITATTSSVPYNAGANPDGTGITVQRFVTARIQYNAYTGHVAGTAQWTATLEASDSEAGTYKALGSTVLDPTNPDKIAEIGFSGIQLCNVVNTEPGSGTPAFLRVTFTLVGAAGSLTPGCDLGTY